MKRTAKFRPVCRCSAYRFPHRLFSGACEGDAEESYERNAHECDLSQYKAQREYAQALEG